MRLTIGGIYMKKYFCMLFAVLLLAACTVKNELQANIADFEDSGFKNNAGQVIALTDKGLLISGQRSTSDGRKNSDIDMFLANLQIAEGEMFSEIYEDTEISTEGSKYTVVIDKNIQFEFEKIGDRIIKDTQGVEYYTQEYTGE